jgi:hypothetical protein
MDSLYLWSVQAPPTELRYGQWWATLNGGDERTIIAQLQARQRVCVVKNQAVANFWLQGRQLPSSPVFEFSQQPRTVHQRPFSVFALVCVEPVVLSDPLEPPLQVMELAMEFLNGTR